MIGPCLHQTYTPKRLSVTVHGQRPQALACSCCKFVHQALLVLRPHYEVQAGENTYAGLTTLLSLFVSHVSNTSCKLWL